MQPTFDEYAKYKFLSHCNVVWSTIDYATKLTSFHQYSSSFLQIETDHAISV